MSALLDCLFWVILSLHSSSCKCVITSLTNQFLFGFPCSLFLIILSYKQDVHNKTKRRLYLTCYLKHITHDRILIGIIQLNPTIFYNLLLHSLNRIRPIDIIVLKRLLFLYKSFHVIKVIPKKIDIPCLCSTNSHVDLVESQWRFSCFSTKTNSSSPFTSWSSLAN